MFIVNLVYKKPIAEVEKYVAVHRKFLDDGYKNNYFLVSGPKNPRSGGIIVSMLNDKKKLQELMQQDPFFIHEIADYEITEFLPVKCHDCLKQFLELS